MSLVPRSHACVDSDLAGRERGASNNIDFVSFNCGSTVHGFRKRTP
jgi:hypothetical protein